MLEKFDAGLTVTQAARERIEAHLNNAGSNARVPALMLERADPAILRWRIVYYDRDVVLGAEFKALVFEVDGMQMILPQWNFAELIRGAQLDWTGSSYTVNGRSELPIEVSNSGA